MSSDPYWEGFINACLRNQAELLAKDLFGIVLLIAAWKMFI